MQEDAPRRYWRCSWTFYFFSFNHCAFDNKDISNSEIHLEILEYDRNVNKWKKKKTQIISNVLERNQNSNILRVDVFPIVTVSNSLITYNWIFTGRTDAEAETPNMLATWCKGLTLWERPWCWKDWRQEEKGTTEDEIVEWHHQLQWIWVWTISGRWWRTGKPGVLQLQKFRNELTTDQQQPQLTCLKIQSSNVKIGTKSVLCIHCHNSFPIKQKRGMYWLKKKKKKQSSNCIPWVLAVEQKPFSKLFLLL